MMKTHLGWFFGLFACVAQAEPARTLYFSPDTANDASAKYNNFGYKVYGWANWTNAAGERVSVAANDQLVVNHNAIISAGGGTAVALHGITWQNNSQALNQGTLILAGGGSGYVETVQNRQRPHYGTLMLKGSGEVPVVTPSGAVYAVQVGINAESDQLTLVKRGAGALRVTDGAWCSGSRCTLKKLRLEAGMFYWCTYGAGGKRIDDHQIYPQGQDLVFADDGSTAEVNFNINNLDCELIDCTFREAPTAATPHHYVDSADTTNVCLRFTGTPGLADTAFGGAFRHCAGLVWNPASADRTFSFTNATSTTRGRLEVRNGTVRVRDGATFTALSEIKVGATGAFELAADAGNAFMADALDVAAGGKVRVGVGKTLTVLALTVDGAAQGYATYTAADASAWLEGEGSVTVQPYRNPNPIVVEIPEGVNADLATALATYIQNGRTATLASLNGGADATSSLVKRGLGTLSMTNAIPSYEGALYFEAGVVFCGVRYAFGKEWNAAAPVSVSSGATLSCASTNDCLNVGRTLYVAGTGAAGYNGALYSTPNRVKNNYDLQNVFGQQVRLTADARVAPGTWTRVGNEVYLQGHTLTVRGISANDHPLHMYTVQDDGDIVIEKGQWRGFNIALNGTAARTVTFRDGGGLRFVGNTPEFTGSNLARTTFRFTGTDDTDLIYTDYDLKPRDARQNLWDFPAILDTRVSFMYQSDRRYGFVQILAPISGTGGFSCVGSRNVFLHLLNTACTYTGGILFGRGTIWAYGNGAIPNGPDAGAVTLAPDAAPFVGSIYTNTFDGVAFMCPDTYALPELKVAGSFPARVQNGQGAWRRVTVTGTGGVDYYSALGAPLLDLQKGTFKLPRGVQPGLWEGTNVFANAAAAQAAHDAGTAYTNLAVRGPTTAIRRNTYNYTNWKANELVTYTGYVWNRTASDATVTFASALDGAPVTVKIDGTTVLTAAASAFAKANVTLAPGPHAFEYRAWSGSTVPAPRATNWRSNFGFVYDAQGRDSTDPNDYAFAVDTGDGALFTRSTNTVENLPVFGEMACAAGTTIDVNGNAYTAADVSGWPVVTNTATDASAAASFAITNRFIVNGATVAADRALVARLPLSFGTTGGVLATNLDALAHGTYTIATAPAPIVFEAGATPLRRRLATDNGKWLVRTSEDGTALQLVHSVGTVLVVR